MFDGLKQRWDDICTRCGLCCFQRDRVEGELVIHEHAPCRFLDTEKRLCTVYDTRLSTCKECRKLTVFHALFSRYLPDSCGYVETLRIWRRVANPRRPVQTQSSETPSVQGTPSARPD